MPLDTDTAALLDAHVEDGDAVRTIIFGRCWADSPWSEELRLSLDAGESIEQCADRLDLAWSPGWLLDAGYELRDAGRTALGLGTPAAVGGPVEWVPEVRLPKVDDQVLDAEPEASPKHARRLAGEVALAALWRRTARRSGIPDDIRPAALTGGGRGARFKNAVV